MATYDWSPAIETGNPTLDEQHRMLFALANQLSDAVAACTQSGGSVCQADEETLANAIYGLVGYCVEHFECEEALMAAAGYPLLPTHRIFHERLSSETLKHAANYFNDEGIVPETLAPFFAEWLYNHIRREDTRFVAFLRETQAARQAG
jgi:hemerythrin